MRPANFFARQAKRLMTRPVRPERPVHLRVDCLEDRVTPAVTGVVFQDFNADGTRDLTSTIPNAGGGTIGTAVDRGLGGVTVTAYDSAGAERGTATTDPFGAYTLTVSGAQTDPLRIEFTTLPTGFSPGPVGPDNGTSVRFVPDGNEANIDFGAVLPADYSDDNPLLATNLYQQEHFNGANQNQPALIAAPYAASGSNPATNRPISVPYGRLGSAFGLGWDRVSRNLYNSAFFKRHAGLGPNGTGAIYRIPVPANPGPDYQPPAGSLLYADLNAIFGANTAGIDTHDTVDNGTAGLSDDYDTDNLSVAALAARSFGGDQTAARAALVAQGIDPNTAHLGWDGVGKTALGGLDVSDDGRFVFVMNLADRQLYRVPTSGPLNAATVQRVSIPLTNPNAAVIPAGRFRSADLRPFAVEYHQGQVYVGAVYTAETLAAGFGDQTARDELLAVVYRLDPAAMTFEAAPRATFRLNYPRIQSTIGFAEAGLPSTWEPWVDRYDSTAAGAARGVAPQPMLTGLTFDAVGNLTLGIRDRGSDQIGYFSLSDPASASTRVEGFTAGDILRATVNTVNDLSSGWTLESNARVANNLTAAGGQFGTGGQTNDRGPGGGEFYHAENFQTSHGETSMGGTLQLPGFPDVVFTNMDPLTNTRAGGWSWASTQTGAEVKAYEVYHTTNGNQPLNTFGKANGLGELVALVGNAPKEVGNRVWADADADGVQDPGEAGIAEVTVELWDLGADGLPGGGDDSKVASVGTDFEGRYYFSEAKNLTDLFYVGGLTLLANRKYEVRIPNAEGAGQQTPLATGARIVTRADADPSANGDTRDSDARLQADGTTAAIPVTTGGAGVSSHTFDAGFSPPLRLGNLVWDDLNNNGQRDAGEPGIDGVTVNLLSDLGAGFEEVDSQVTANGGAYLFAGLSVGTYKVEIVPPAGYVTSTGNGQASQLTRLGSHEPGVSGTQNDQDHGTAAAGNVFGGSVFLDASVNPDQSGAANLRQDFGLVRTFSLGNRVWLDKNNSGTIDAADGGTPGIDGVTVFLVDAAGVAILDAAGNPLQAITAGGGYYRFDNLAAGDYRVRIATADSQLAGLRSSTGALGATGPNEGAATPDPDLAPADSDDNGTTVGGFVQSAVVTLGAAADEPTGEADLSGGQGALDGQANMTVDFGFVRPVALGNRVWFDLNNDGAFGAGDANGPAGVLVSLLDAAGNPVLDGGGTAITTATDANGYYLFGGLNPGQYKVAVAAANFNAGQPLRGYVSSTGNGPGTTTGPNEGMAANAGDNADSGNRSGGAVVSSVVTIVSGGATTGEPAAPGNADPTADADSELTVDFGFFPRLSLGNRVWEDADNDGGFDAGEAPLAGLTVRLLDSLGNPVTNAGGPIVTTTNANGYYLFDNLTPGMYAVEVVTPAGYLSSTGANGSASGPFEPGVGTGGDDNDHGSAVGAFLAATAVRSKTVNLQANGATTGEAAGVGVADGALDANSEQTIDFGLFRPLSLGNRVWIDANNNGRFDAGESPVVGAAVELLDAAGNPVLGAGGVPITTTTNAQGFYLFSLLRPGDYRVGVAATNFAGGGPLAGFVSSTGGANGVGPFEGQAGRPGNNFDAGNTVGTLGNGGRVVSNTVTLAVGTLTTNDEGANGNTPGIADPARDQDSEVTIDFGFFRPLRLGNLVWNDADNSGTVTGGEAGVPDVGVRLFRDSDGNGVPDTVQPLATTKTDANGNYTFTGLGTDKFVVEIDPATFPGGYWLSSTGKNGSAAGPFETAPSPDTDTDNDDNGTTAGTVIRSGTVTLSPNAEPTADGDDADGNLTVDFGIFQPVALGNLVWDDANNNGTRDAGEPGLAGRTVNLYAADGVTKVATTTTDANGEYGFSTLAPGGYIVEVAGPAGYVSSIGKNGFAAGPFEAAPSPNTDADNDDNGTTSGNVVRSGLVTLTVGGEPTGEASGLADPTPDASRNTTVDFGFFRPLSLGNLVWFDANNDGKFDGTEKAAADVPVRLLDANGVEVATTTTDANGNYLFTNLGAGGYRVEITAPVGYTSSSGQLSSVVGPFEPAPNDDTNSDDAGTAVTQLGNVIRSGVVTLTAGTEPIDDGDLDANSNLSIDFGILPVLALGNLVWEDANNNGRVDAGEPGIAGVTVNLYQDANQDGVPDTAAPYRTTTTGPDGKYLFTGLLTQGYIVEVLDPAGYAPASGKNGTTAAGPFEPAPSPENDADDDDNGTIAGPGRVRSGTVVLQSDGEPTTEDGNPNTNLTVDFGYFRPLSLGNLVWNDANNNGRVDAGEPGLANVPVRLFDAGGTLIGTTTTAADGTYTFTNLTPGGYAVVVDLPAGFVSSTGGTNGSGPFEAAPSPEGDADSDDNGTAVGGVVRSSPVTLTLGGEPVNGDTNPTIDFGAFRPLSLGNLVWNDINNNGRVDAGEPGVGGVTVRLFRDDDGNGLPDTASPLGTVTTNATGNYLFTGLGTGQYVVEIAAPAGFVTSSGKNGALTGPFEIAPSPNTDADNDDNGTTAGGVIRSGTVNLSPGAEPTADGDDVDSNLTVDFGLYVPLSLGNLVWNDANNNGRVDAGEPGLGNVPVRLFDATGTLIGTTTTAADGTYTFPNLAPGDYAVEITPPAGFVSSSGGTNGSGPFEAAPNPNTDADADDNGTTSGVVVRSGPVTLTVGGEPNGNDNPTVDFGLLRPLSLGNLVWNDKNNNGRVDAGEPGVGGVRVTLFRDDDRDGTPDGPALGSLVTTADGGYLFTQLGEGGYVVEIDAATLPAGFVTSSGTNGSRTGPFETAPSPEGDTDGDDNGSAAGGVIRSRPVVLTLGGEPVNGDTNPTVDFGVFQPLSFGNTVWRDDNNNGRLDPNEPVLPNIPVRLYDAGGTLIASTVTGPNGTYLFTDLATGGYSVEITPPAGVRPSDPVFDPTAGGDNVNIGTARPGGVIRSPIIELAPGTAPLVGGNTDPNNFVIGDFGLLGVAQVSGYVYRDPDNNGVFDRTAGDTPIGGVTITITGTDLVGNPLPPRTTTTDATGFYRFTELVPGNYTITETQPGSILYDGRDTPGSVGGATPRNDVLTVRLEPNANGKNYNFGELPPAAVFGSVYHDTNFDGLRDAGDVGIGGVPIAISGTAFFGTDLARPLTAADVPGGLTTTTDPTGRYQFPVLPPGRYTLTEPTQPAGFMDALESDRDPRITSTIGNDVIADLTALANGVYGPFDFGEVRPDPSKRQFLSSTPVMVAGTTAAARADLRMTPAFSVTTGTPTEPAYVIVAAGAGLAPYVRVFDYATGGEKFRFLAYEPGFTGGVRVASGDFDGDGIADIVTGIGVGGGPRIRVFSGKDGSAVRDMMAYEESFRGGLFVAAGDVDGDGVAEIITGVDTGGGPRVRVLDGRTLAVVADFFAFDETQRGGVRVAAGDFNGDGKAEIVAVTGPGVPTRVRVIDAATLGTLRDFSPFEAGFTGGVYLAAGDVNGDGVADLLTGAEAGGGPRVQAFDGTTGERRASFFAYDDAFRGGVRVAARDVDGDGKAEIVTAPASALSARVRVFGPAGDAVIDDFTAFDPDFTGGVFVG